LTAPHIQINPLSYETRLIPRIAESIDLVVIHCTELPDLETAQEYGEVIHHPESSTGNSGHFYIDRDGSIEQWVDPLFMAHHVAGHNENSIGIELVNLGRYPNWLHSDSQTMTEVYPETQINSLILLLNHLVKRFPTLTDIAGHADLDRRMVPATDNPDLIVTRKMDPGPVFPWDSVLDMVTLTRQTEYSD
jgi:N-acetylmuramoyl-L-alanine amidase